jgi:hypothetical protein
MNLSKDKQTTIDNLVNDLQKVKGVIAIVLGGSYAAGVAKEDSDMDIGIYYSTTDPFSIDDIRTIASKYSVAGDITVTNFYEWGPWVNGGAWIQASCGQIDFIYRNLEQVSTTIEKAKKGEWENHFEQQPPYGFSSDIYLAEISSSISLYDPQGHISHLKKEVQIYPEKLKRSVISQSLWSAEFAIWHAEYFFSKNKDIYNIAGCLTRATKNIAAALFAINEIYPLGDKRAINILEKAPKCPNDLGKKVENTLALNKKIPNKNVELLKNLFDETVKLAGEYYRVFPFNLKKINLNK